MQPELEIDLERYRAVLESHLGDALVTLAVFGSQVTGRAKPESDVDVLVVARGLPKRRMDRRRLVGPFGREVSDGFAQSLSTILLTPEEATTIKPFYLGFLEGHELLVDRDGFFRAVLDRLECRLKELGSVRLVDELGNPYWDLKPDYKLGEDVVL